MDERITIDVNLGTSRMRLDQTGDALAALELARVIVEAARREHEAPADGAEEPLADRTEDTADYCGRGVCAKLDGHGGPCSA